MESNEWVTLITAIVLPVLLSIPAFIMLLQNKNRLDAEIEQREEESKIDKKRYLSEEAIDLYDRVKAKAEGLQQELLDMKETMGEAQVLKEEMESLKNEQVYLKVSVDKMKEEIAILAKALDEAISTSWKLHDQLLDHHIKPVVRPGSRRKDERIDE